MQKAISDKYEEEAFSHGRSLLLTEEQQSFATATRFSHREGGAMGGVLLVLLVGLVNPISVMFLLATESTPVRGIPGSGCLPSR